VQKHGAPAGIGGDCEFALATVEFHQEESRRPGDLAPMNELVTGPS